MFPREIILFVYQWENILGQDSPDVRCGVRGGGEGAGAPGLRRAEGSLDIFGLGFLIVEIIDLRV